MKKLLKDFQDFITRGNAIDLAIGIIIGAAFTAVVNSIVNNLIMPPFGAILTNTDFQDLFIILRQGEEALPPGATLQMAQEVGAVTFNYGLFISDLINFIIIGFGVFLIVKGIQKMEKRVERIKELVAEGKETPDEEPKEKNCPYCYKTIPFKAARCPFCTSHINMNSVNGNDHL